MHLIFPVEEVCKLEVADLAITVLVTEVHQLFQQFRFNGQRELQTCISQLQDVDLTRAILSIQIFSISHANKTKFKAQGPNNKVSFH